MAKHLRTVGATAQLLFFIPDLMKAYNYNDYTPLVTLGGIMLGDHVARTIQRGIVQTLNPIINENIFGLLQKYVAGNPQLKRTVIKIVSEHSTNVLEKFSKTSPIFTILTLYSIAELHKEISKIPNQSQEYKIITHHIYEQYASLCITVVEFFIPEIAPVLWAGLLLEQLIYGGEALNIEYDLNINVLEAVLMSLGFEQDKLSLLIEESHLLKINLDNIQKFNLPYKTWNIIRIPKIKDITWRPINANEIPKSTMQALQQGYDDNAQCDDYTCTREVNGFRLRKHYVSGAFPAAELVYSRTSYAMAYYEIERLEPKVKLGTNNPLKISALIASARSMGGDAFFPASIKYNNITWVRNRDVTPGVDYVRGYAQADGLKYMPLYIHFDAREGDMAIDYTPWSTNAKSYEFIINIAYKTYPPSLVFHARDDKIPAKFSVFDASRMMQTRYFISDNKKYQISDNAYNTTIICNGNNVINNILNIRSDTKENILLGNVNISTTDREHLYLHCNTCVIDGLLNISAMSLTITYVLGSGTSDIVVGEENRAFFMTLRGNINIKHLTANLQVSGVTNTIANNLPYYNHTKYDYIHRYTITVPKIQDIFDTLQLSRWGVYNSINFSYNNVNWKWDGAIGQNNTLCIKASIKCTLLEISDNALMLQYDCNTIRREFMHYNPYLVLNDGAILEKIFYKTLNVYPLQEFQGVIEPSFAIPPLLMYSIIPSVSFLSILLFKDELNKTSYHIFPRRIDDVNINYVNINNVNYTITDNKICASYHPNIHEIGRQLKYQSNLDSQQIKTIGICFEQSLYKSRSFVNNHLLIGNLNISNLPDNTYIYFGDTIVKTINDLKTELSKQNNSRVRRALEYDLQNIAEGENNDILDYDTNNHRNHRAISEDNDFVQPASSSASRPEFVPVKLVKTIWSKLVNMVKYLDTKNSTQVTTPLSDKNYNISIEDTSIKTHNIDNIDNNYTHNDTTAYSPITRVQDIKFIPDSANAHNKEYHSNSNGIDLSRIDNSSLLLVNSSIN